MTLLSPLLHDEPAALLAVEVECVYGRGLCGCSIRRIDEAEDLAMLADERNTPGAELLGGALLRSFGHVARTLARCSPGRSPGPPPLSSAAPDPLIKPLI